MYTLMYAEAYSKSVFPIDFRRRKRDIGDDEGGEGGEGEGGSDRGVASGGETRPACECFPTALTGLDKIYFKSICCPIFPFLLAEGRREVSYL